LDSRNPAEKFGPLRLKALREKIIGENQSRNFINSTVKKIRPVFKWASGEELMPVTVFQALLTVEGSKKVHGTGRPCFMGCSSGGLPAHERPGADAQKEDNV
jgi:hypothetical protein